MYLTYQEIVSQYAALKQTIASFENKGNDISDFFCNHANRPLVFLGSGSSYSLAKSAEFAAKTQYGREAFSLPAGDFMLNFDAYEKIWANAVIVAISRSGSTSEVLNSIRAARGAVSAPVVSICCVQDAPISKIADLNLELPWAFDKSVCQTRSVSNLYAALLLLLAFANGDRAIAEDLRRAAATGDTFLSANEKFLRGVAEEDWNSAVVLADGVVCGLAEEGALAFKEICNVPSSYHHVLDYRHGPMVLADSHTLFLVRVPKGQESYVAPLVREILDKGSRVVLLADDACSRLPEEADTVTVRGGIGSAASGLQFVNLAQLISYYKALQKGLNPDLPNGLDAWIKL